MSGYDEDEAAVPLLATDVKEKPLVRSRVRRRRPRVKTALIVICCFALSVALWFHNVMVPCDTVLDGFQCEPEISHSWGQYSPWFTVPSEISDVLPKHCEITFAQILSRHGARYPTLGPSIRYGATIAELQANVTTFKGKYRFLNRYEYNLGANGLTELGRHQLIYSGIKFYMRYHKLGATRVPFFRAAGSQRVIESAQKFAKGFHDTRAKDPKRRGHQKYPYDILIIPEADWSNNTLDHGHCASFESGPDSNVGYQAMDEFAEIFVPPIQRRLNQEIEGASLSRLQTLDLMELCPFETVNSDGNLKSAFCNLFTDDEWIQYDYYQSLGKYYGYGGGHPLGPTQGVGFANELISRMTGLPVDDDTSTNHTLDGDPKTFPIGSEQVFFADFSHDNDMIGHFWALGLYNQTKPLSKTSVEDANVTHGYSAAWAVPFAARAYFEKMRCEGEDEELVRILVNDRVIPLQNCGADEFGRCRLSRWVESLSFARENGRWDKCFLEDDGS